MVPQAFALIFSRRAMVSIVRCMAAGSVGQAGALRGRQGIEQTGLAGILADVGAA
jgi:hypothetical protein